MQNPATANTTSSYRSSGYQNKGAEVKFVSVNDKRQVWFISGEFK